MLEGLSLAELGPVGLLSIAVLLILVGRLVPRRSLEDVQKDRDNWRDAHTISEHARTEMRLQLNELLEHARLTNEFMRSLPHPNNVEARSRHDEVVE